MLVLSLGEKRYDVDELCSRYESVEIRNDMHEYGIIFLKRLFAKHKNIVLKTGANLDEYSGEVIKCAVENGISYVDIDWQDSAGIERFQEEVKKKETKTRLVLSCHLLNGYHEIGELEKVFNRMAGHTGSLVKIAVKIESYRKLDEFVKFQWMHKGNVIIGMGNKGRLTRYFNLLSGCPLNYTSLGDIRTAEGQMTYVEAEELLYGKK